MSFHMQNGKVMNI